MELEEANELIEPGHSSQSDDSMSLRPSVSLTSLFHGQLFHAVASKDRSPFLGATLLILAPILSAQTAKPPEAAPKQAAQTQAAPAMPPQPRPCPMIFPEFGCNIRMALCRESPA